MARSMRRGREKSAPISSNVPPTTRPTRRNGSRISQTSGKRITAASARGQQKKARRQKSRKLSIGGVRLLRDFNGCAGEKVPAGLMDDLVDDKSMADVGLQRV